MLFSTAKKVLILLIGGSVIAIGTAMLVLPGPAFIVIPVGLAILGTEFAWAKRVLKRLQQHAVTIQGKLTKTREKDDSAT
jgi:tellurite resistance protein TerC